MVPLYILVVGLFLLVYSHVLSANFQLPFRVAYRPDITLFATSSLTMAQQTHDVLSMDDKRLRLAEEGLQHAPAPVPARAGLANPAPLGLLCFGMTTGR